MKNQKSTENYLIRGSTGDDYEKYGKGRSIGENIWNVLMIFITYHSPLCIGNMGAHCAYYEIPTWTLNIIFLRDKTHSPQEG